MRLFVSARERRLWLLALAVVAAIYATLGRVPAIAAALEDRGAVDEIFFRIFVVVVVALGAAAVARRPGWRETGVLIAVLGTYATAFLRFGSPAERTHLFEYGVVALLIHAALLERRAHGGMVRAPAAVAVVGAATLGWIDEGVQAVLPDRVFDPIDLAFNTAAAVLPVLAATGLRWARSRRDPRPSVD